MPRTGLALLVGAVLGCSSVWGQATREQVSPENLRFFENKIRPLFAEHCLRCHGPERQRAGLRLDTLEHIVRGGDSGPAVVSGKPEASLLMRAVRHQNDLKMPPQGKLSERQIGDLARWIREGTPFPKVTSQPKTGTMRDHWAFQPPREPKVPAVGDARWPQSDLDRFLLARLEAKGLAPAPPADRRTLIRRATFDLLGLPPTPEEVAAFLADKSPDAFARVVDRLLASPHYGERWGRHWLDVARYADSNGLDENIAFGNAWRYRDYVVDAFNRDTPYDQFLLEQLAGDLLPTEDAATRRTRLIATGFLALGPKVLAEGDEKKMELDIIDEQIDTLGRTVLGLTLGCARCHDHKFDPITARDYHALAGIFVSTRTMESFKRVARWYEHPIATEKEKARRAEHDRKVAQAKEALQAATKTASEKVRAEAPAGKPLPKNLEPLFPPQVQAELKRLRGALAELERNTPDLPTAMGVAEGLVTDVPVYIRGDHLKPGDIVPRQVPVVLAGPAPPDFVAGRSGRLELARWLVRPDHPLTARVMVNRIWRWRFGRGLVPTPDNFGHLGEAPDHPELLDWLTRRFVASGWSIKALHRLMMLSATYRMSSVADPDATAAARRVDPENRLHWRADVRRLEAEAIRDNMLAASGLLDRTLGGSLLHVKNRAYFFDHTSKDTTKYDSRRRALYLPVVRNNVYDQFQLFDFPDPAVANGDRATTTLATQALFFLNSDWVSRVCEDWASNLLRTPALDDAARVDRIHRRAFARPPTAEEAAASLDLVRGIDRLLVKEEPNAERRRVRAWAGLCRTIFSANEFIHVR